jgi:c-di-GMP-binding flagellar brake protein YcgR
VHPGDYPEVAMKLDDIGMGTKLELEIHNDDNKPGKKFVSEFEWAEGNNTLFVATPISGGRVYPVSIGAKVNMYFIQGNNLLRFRAKVTDRGVKNNISLLKLKTDGEIEKIQRREFFRFDWNVPVNYRVLNSAKSGDADSRSFVRTITRDLSGGGVCIKLKEKIDYEKYIECELLFDTENKISFIGKIVRFTMYESKQGEYSSEVGVMFEKIDEKDRDRVISLIFQEQRRLIKKG